MKLTGALTFAAGFLTAAGLAVLVADVGAQADEGIHVCVAPDGVMHLARTPACPPDQKSLYFKKPEADLEAPKPTPDSTASQSSVDQARLDSLQREVSELEQAEKGGELGNRVVAPFEVVDRSGNRLFYVNKEGEAVLAQLYNGGGTAVATIAALGSGGQFVARQGDSGRATYMGVFRRGNAAGLQVMEDGETRVMVGRDEKSGAYLFKVFGASGKAIAGIGQNKLGTGTAQVAQADGTVKALMTVDESGRGRAAIFGPSATEVAILTEGASGGGLLTINDASGATPMVEAGSNGGVGIVRAGPAGFKPGLGLLGLPGSYIAGKP